MDGARKTGKAPEKAQWWIRSFFAVKRSSTQVIPSVSQNC